MTSQGRSPQRVRLVVTAVVLALAAGVLPGHGWASPDASPSPAASRIPGPTSPAAASPGAPSVPPSMDVFTDDATTLLLATAGIGVYADERATEPLVPLRVGEVSRVTTWQLRNMAAEARAGGGIAGRDLDRAVRLKHGGLPFSYLVAAWLSTSPSPGSSNLVITGFDGDVEAALVELGELAVARSAALQPPAPDPTVVAMHADPALEALFPETIGGEPLVVQSMVGEAAISDPEGVRVPAGEVVWLVMAEEPALTEVLAALP